MVENSFSFAVQLHLRKLGKAGMYSGKKFYIQGLCSPDNTLG